MIAIIPRKDDGSWDDTKLQRRLTGQATRLCLMKCGNLAVSFTPNVRNSNIATSLEAFGAGSGSGLLIRNPEPTPQVRTLNPNCTCATLSRIQSLTAKEMAVPSSDGTEARFQHIDGIFNPKVMGYYPRPVINSSFSAE